MAEGGGNNDGRPIAEVPPKCRTLLVQGLPHDVSDELLELYFENPKYGGSDIESIKKDGNDRAWIVFREAGGTFISDLFILFINLCITLIHLKLL